MYLSELHLENFRRFEDVTIVLRSGMNVFVGENDSGKSSILDAIRLVLGTTSQDFFRIEDDDFHVSPEGVSEYQLTRALPDDLKPSLPTVEEIEREIADAVIDDDGSATGRLVREMREKYGTAEGQDR